MRDRPAGHRHGAFVNTLVAWAPLTAVLVSYAAAAWVNGSIDVQRIGERSNRLGIQLHVAETAAADRGLFGVLPTAWLQGLLLHGSAQWYDAVAALVYVTHFIALPVLTMLVWFRMRDRFAAWVVVLLGFTVLGIAGYVFYPAAPPWLASQQHAIGTVHRLSTVGWSYLHLPGIGGMVRAGQHDGNPVAAMPSLHAGGALVVALFLWPVVGRVLRLALGAYVVLMALTLVYTGEHYVVDVLAGWLVAVVAVVVGAAVTGCRPRRRPATGHANSTS